MISFDTAANIVATGIGATLIMDVFAFAQKRLLGIPSLDYRLVGRWLICTMNGQFRHDTILQTPPRPFERSVGWVVHYAIGVIFLIALLAVVGLAWLDEPRLWPALAAGLVSVLAPFAIMQPALGFGFAASKTPSPLLARMKSVVTHLSYGLGLYLTASLLVAL
ncbi:MAG: DUF2938 domain-containing protein [Stappiaceae bacterium]